MNARTLAPLALLLAAGCAVDNYASVQFFEICFPPTPTENACIYPSACENTLLGRPFVDVSGAFNLEVPIELRNQLPVVTDTSTGRVNTSDAHVEKYTISYSYAGTALPGTTSLTNDTVPAAGNTVVLVEVLPNSTVNALATVAPSTPVTLDAFVVASGRYDNGNNFTTGKYKISIDVCNCGAVPLTSLCPTGQSFSGGCPGSAVQGGAVVTFPFNFTCQ